MVMVVRRGEVYERREIIVRKDRGRNSEHALVKNGWGFIARRRKMGCSSVCTMDPQSVGVSYGFCPRQSKLP